MKEDIKQNIYNIVKNDDNVIALYNYGSHVYQTATEKSDTDFIIVLKEKNNLLAVNEIIKHADVNIYEKLEFEKLIEEHEISVLECLFLKPQYIWKESNKWDFNLSLPQLRKACSAKSSNSWVKAKKKLIVDEDYNLYIGQKSAWHAIRILEFGRQIATTGKIDDFTAVNHLYLPILACPDWLTIDSKFRQVYNSTSTNFKLVAPKETIDTKDTKNKFKL